MHELGLAHDVLRTCSARVPANARITRVRLLVGDLAAVEPELLRFGWQAVVEGTPHAGAALEIDWRPARQLCEACGVIPERAAGSWLKLCPRCGIPLQIDGGQELEVRGLTYETADEAVVPAEPLTP
jgi:hydrogenase nickel incorporation protein HypA/HybF